MSEVVHDLEEKRINKGLAGTTISTQLTTYRMKVFETALCAKLSMGMLERFKPDLVLNGSMHIGNAKDLPRTLVSAVVSKELTMIGMMLNECYPYFSTFSDGSPVGADTGFFIVRAVNKKLIAFYRYLFLSNSTVVSFQESR